MMVGSMAMPSCWPLRRNSQSPCPVGDDSIRDHLFTSPHGLTNGHRLRHMPSNIGRSWRSTIRSVSASAGPGGGVLDKPTTTPDITKKPDRRKRKPPIYRVLLHNDDYNKREYVVQVLLKVVEGFTVEDALNVMQEAHFNGLALVTICSQDQAEYMCERLRLSGLISTIEPCGNNGGGAAA